MLTRFLAYLSPVIMALVIPFLLNHPKTRFTNYRLQVLIPAGISVLIILIALAVVVIFSGGLTLVGYLKLAAFLIGYGLMLTSLCLLMMSSAVSSNLTQVIVTALAFLMLGTVFYANPLIESTPSNQIRQGIVQWSINLNPILVIAGTVFNYDIMLSPLMYRISLIQYYPHYYPEWWNFIVAYLVVGLICLGGILLTRRVMRVT